MAVAKMAEHVIFENQEKTANFLGIGISVMNMTGKKFFEKNLEPFFEAFVKVDDSLKHV